jgi:hypothetical protein
LAAGTLCDQRSGGICRAAIRAEEAYEHCSKAIRRSGIWDPKAQIARKTAPSLKDLMSAHLNYDKDVLDDMGVRIKRDIKTNMD